MVGDTGIITTVAGGKYIIAVQVQRPHNDRRANELVRKLSGITYNGFTLGQGPMLVKPKDKPSVMIGNHGLSPNAATTGSDLLKTEPRVQSESYGQNGAQTQSHPDNSDNP